MVIESGDPGGAFRFPGVTHGDYFFGAGLEEHLAENNPNRYGTPPVSKSAVEGLRLREVVSFSFPRLRLCARSGYTRS